MSLLSFAQERLGHPFSPEYPAVAPPCHPGSSIMTDGHLGVSLTEKQAHHWTGSRVTVDVLPDVVLLEIFSFYVDDAWMEAWHTLVHVCRKWRSVVFGSQRRLNLRLRCTAGTQARETLGIWPLLPIDIKVFGHEMWGKWGADNILAAFESNDRICRIDLFYIPNLELEKILAAMQQPFSALTRLRLQSRDYTAPAIPASFLGGSAPHLQSLILDRIPFPGLPKLLLTSTHLVSLRLWETPDSGYISPEAMVTCLSMLTRLERLDIGFESPRCYPDRKSRRPPPQTRTLLPALTTLRFRGVGKYLEDIVARIDSPLLDDLVITFFHQLILDTPQLTQFITRTPKFKAHDEARVYFSNCGVWVTLPQAFDGVLNVGISCGQSDWQLSSLAQICSSIFPHAFIPVLEHLYVLEERFSRLCWQDDIEASQWLDLLRPFIAVKSLYVSREFAPHIAPALQELVEELPALQTLFLEEPFPSGPVQEIIEHFVAARHVDSHPIAVSCWERK